MSAEEHVHEGLFTVFSQKAREMVQPGMDGNSRAAPPCQGRWLQNRIQNMNSRKVTFKVNFSDQSASQDVNIQSNEIPRQSQLQWAFCRCFAILTAVMSAPCSFGPTNINHFFAPPVKETTINTN